MIKKVVFALILLCASLTGCSTNTNQTSQLTSKEIQQSKKGKLELSKLKDLYSKKQYLDVIRVFNQYKNTQSKELNKVYNQAFEALYNEKQYSTLKTVTDPSNTNIFLGAIPEKNLQKYETALKNQEADSDPILQRLKSLYSDQDYQVLIMTYNELKIFDSTDLNDIYNNTFQRLLDTKQYDTIKKRN